jgi:hypothetical protein
MKMPEPIGWGNHGQIDNINLGYAYIYPAEGTGAHRPVYDKQALIDLLEAAAVECENNYKLFKTYTGTLRSHDQEMASTIRKLKEKL